ncbi:MAG: hypothetical protein LQ342_006794 [Letrouitia transgressa]|nr:MAG: hypothetical protein LQ342_006794 [Letrouitia transgressa]
MSNPSDTLKGLTGLAPQAMTLLEGAESLSLLPEEVAYTEEIAREFRKNNGPRFDLLDSYWNSKEIEDTVNQFMFNDLIRAMAFFPEDPRNLAAFKEYMLQDHWFLIELYKFKEKCLQSITKYDSASYANEMAGLARFKDEYIDGEFKLMLETLGVAHLRDHVEPHEVTKAYCDWMMKRAELDSFFELNLIQAPCTYVSISKSLFSSLSVHLTKLVGLVKAGPRHLSRQEL